MMIDTIKELNECRRVLSLSPPDEKRFRSSFDLAQQDARAKLAKLEEQLATEVASIAVPVFISGKNAAALARSMSGLVESAVVDLADIYSPLTSMVRESVGRKNEFGINQYTLLIREVRRMATKSGVASMAIPNFREPEVFQSEQELSDIVRRYVDNAVGTDMSVGYIRTMTVQGALKIKQKSPPVFLVFVVNAPQNKISQRIFPKGLDVLLEAPDVVDEDSTVNALKTIKKALKPTKE